MGVYRCWFYRVVGSIGMIAGVLGLRQELDGGYRKYREYIGLLQGARASGLEE